MSGRYLLDTNIVIALFADESAVKDRLGEAEEVFVPSDGGPSPGWCAHLRGGELEQNQPLEQSVRDS